MTSKTSTAERDRTLLKVTPRRSYLSSTTSRRTFRGTQDTRKKDKHSLDVYMKADGSREALMSIIGKSKIILAASTARGHRSNISARPTGGPMQNFRAVVVGGHVRRHTPEPRLMLMDRYASHIDPEDPRNQVMVITYPASSTSIHHPADTGTIAVLEVQSRSRLRKIRLSTTSITEQLQVQTMTRKMRAATVGLAECHNASVRDACEILGEA